MTPSDALLCIGCGIDALGGANGGVAIYVGDRDIVPWCKRCHAYMQAELADKSEDPDATAPATDAERALARFGAMVLDWSPLEAGFPTIPGGVIDDLAVRAGAAIEDASDGGHACWIAPGVKLAIARLLAPDGAEEVVDDGA